MLENLVKVTANMIVKGTINMPVGMIVTKRCFSKSCILSMKNFMLC
jgi:hypothetical protein